MMIIETMDGTQNYVSVLFDTLGFRLYVHILSYSDTHSSHLLVADFDFGHGHDWSGL